MTTTGEKILSSGMHVSWQLETGFMRTAVMYAFASKPTDADLLEAHAHMETLKPGRYQLAIEAHGSGTAGRAQVRSLLNDFLGRSTN